MNEEMREKHYLSDDRFEKISNNYGELFSEVFEEQGMDYGEFERSVFREVSKIENFKELPILDIGVGDGETSEPFIEEGCSNLTGLDLNPEMLKQAKEKYGEKIKLIQGDATNLYMFNEGQFPVIIAAAIVHNIPKEDRPKFWSEIKRLAPKLLVMAEKIVHEDPEKQQEAYDKEVAAIDLVYNQKHNLPEAAKEWIDHYEYDDRERLELKEITDYLSNEYDINVCFEMGLYKTVVCKKK